MSYASARAERKCSIIMIPSLKFGRASPGKKKQYGKLADEVGAFTLLQKVKSDC